MKILPAGLYPAAGTVRGLVIYFSDAQGWDKQATRTARGLARDGLAVVGVDTPQFLRQLDRSSAACIHPVQPLMVLAQDAEHRLGWASYAMPALAGRGLGGTVAYASLAQAVPGIFTAGVSAEYRAFLPGEKRWCPLNGFTASRVEQPRRGWRPGPTTQLPTPWRILANDPDAAAAAGPVLTETPNASRVIAADETAGIEASLAPLIRKADQGSLADLPLTPVAAAGTPASPFFAVLYSGDGGWAGLDRQMADEFARRGIPVVGFDCLSYFWRTRTPQGAARDLSRILDHFSRQWDRPKAIVIGYSYGADVLPFIVDRLAPEARSRLARVSLMGLDSKADFQFHLGSWLDLASDDAMPTVPQVDGLRGVPLQCIRGVDERNSACPAIAPGAVQQVTLPGGHHFNDDARALVGAMVEGLNA